MELSKVIDSQVSSGLTEKRYRTNINEIHPEDDKQTSELYEVNIFGHILQIAPGLTIKDKEYPKLVYCYVYVILKNKVKAKLGIVEELTDSPPKIFDISLIEDGRLRLFDIYEQNPELVRELEYVQNVVKSVKEQKDRESGYEEKNEDIFDYINKNEIKSKINAKPGYDEMSKEMKKKETEYPTYSKILKGLLKIYKASIVENKIYITTNVVDTMRKEVKDINTLYAVLLILEIGIKQFNIIVLDETENIVPELSMYRKFTTSPTNKSLKYLIVKWDNDRAMLIKKYTSYELLPEKYKTEYEQEKSRVGVDFSESKQAEELPIPPKEIVRKRDKKEESKRSEEESPMPPQTTTIVKKKEESKQPKKKIEPEIIEEEFNVEPSAPPPPPLKSKKPSKVVEEIEEGLENSPEQEVKPLKQKTIKPPSGVIRMKKSSTSRE